MSSRHRDAADAPFHSVFDVGRAVKSAQLVVQLADKSHRKYVIGSLPQLCFEPDNEKLGVSIVLDTANGQMFVCGLIDDLHSRGKEQKLKWQTVGRVGCGLSFLSKLETLF